MHSAEAISNLQFIIEAMPDGILVIDEDEKIVTYNQKYREIWPVPDEILATRDNMKMMHFAARLIKNPDRFIADTKRYHSSVRKEYFDILELNDGRFIERHSTPRQKEGTLFNRILTFRDVTSRVRAERQSQESELRFKQIFSSDMIGMVVTGAHGRVLAANDYFLNLIGYDREEIQSGKVDWHTITAPEYIETTREVIADVQSLRRRVYEKEYVRKDGKRVSALVGVSAVEELQNQMVAFVLDITERKRAEENLRTSDAQFRAIFEGGAFGVTLFGIDGKFITCNPAICEMLGYTEDELKRIGIRGISDPDEFPDQNERLLEDLISGRIEKFELDKCYVRKDGSKVWAYLIVSLVRDSAGTPLFGVGLVIDRDRQKKTEEELKLSEQRFRAVFEAAPAGVILGNLTGNFTRCNSAACQMLGYTEEELIRLGPKGIALQEDHEWIDRLVEALSTGTHDKREAEKRIVRKDGGLSWVSVAASLVRDSAGTPLFSVNVLVDITGRKTAEEAMLNAVRLRDEFIAVASHELRTPITPLRLQNHLLKRHLTVGQFASYPQAASVLKMIDASEQQLDHLVRLIEDMLNASRISSGRLALSLEDVNLSDVVENTIDRHEHELVKAGCPVKIDLAPNAVGRWDRHRLEQVLTNLLTNAAKYGRGKPIDVAVSVDSTQAYLSVRDYGIGIAKEDQLKIFEQFERVAPVNAYGGFGLGLYIARQIVSAHGGTIRVDSELGKGSMFTITLPR
jgi:PAS domain S-box-containing protein